MALDFQTSAAIVFILLLSIFLFVKRKKMDMHGPFPFLYFAMYRTKFGLNFMDWLGRHKKTMHFLGYAGVVIGFLGMIFICFALLQNIYNLFTAPETTPGVGLVLPFKAKGVFFVPFFYWIISIFIIALVHEMAHGVIARAHGLKVKSSGFAFLGIFAPVIPAAFVEPDEKALKKKKHRVQLSVFAAGPFSNVLLALIVLGLMIAIAPAVDNMVELSGVEITDFTEGDYPAATSGIEPGEVVKAVDGKEVETLSNFSDALNKHSPGEVAEITTDKGTYDIKLAAHPQNESIGYLGVSVSQDFEIAGVWQDRVGTFIPEVILWLLGLMRWLVILNLGIGLFNLVPIGPLDGGRMLQLVTHRWFGVAKGNKVWYYISLIFLGVVLANILFAFFV